MPKIRCRRCGERWNPRWGTIDDFQDTHLKKHNLELPALNPDEDSKGYKKRIEVFLDSAFEMEKK